MLPAPGSVEAAFDRYRRTGAPAALSTVFEATAAELLRVAIHLTDDPAMAEDAVQSTFVTAIEKAATFDAARPLLPWLCGILERHAHALRARVRRTPEPARLHIPTVPDPASAAADAEAAARLAAAIDTLPGQYRTVVVLRLRHGLAPAAIADALGEPPGAVRVRLHRGLAMLRERLPRSLSIPGIGAAWGSFRAERGLDIVHRAVAEAGARLVPTSVSTLAAAAAFVVMKKYVFALAVLAVAAVAAVATLSTDAPQRPTTTPDAALDARAAAVGSTDPRQAPAAGSVASTTADPARVAVEAPTAATGPRGIRVIARRKGSGMPIARVGVTVLPMDGRHPDLHTIRHVTDASGAAQFEDLAAGRYGIYTDRTARTWADPEPAREAPANGEAITLDLSQIAWGNALASGPTLEIANEPGAHVGLPLQIDFGSLMAVRSLAGATDITTGEFTPYGGPLLVTVPDYQLSSALPDREPAAIVDVTDGIAFVELAIDAGRAARGRVLDQAGEPVAGAEVWAVHDAGRTAFALGRSHADGSFAVDDIENGVALFARATGYASSPAVGLPADVEASIDLQLGERAATITGRVVDPQGHPVADARVRVGTPDDDVRRIQTPTARDGTFAVPAPATGDVPVLVLASGFQPWVGNVTVQAGGTVEVLAHLVLGAAIEGHVLGPDGAPRGGVLVRAEADGLPPTDVRSGPDGTYRLECVAAGPALLVVDAEGDHRGARVPVVAVAGVTQSVDVPLDRYGHITGRLVDASGQPLARATIRGKAEADGQPLATDRTNADGQFDLETVPGQLYHLDVFPEASAGATFQFRLVSNGANGLVFAMGDGTSDEAPAGRRRIGCDWLGAVPADRADLVIRLGVDMVPSATLRGRVLRPDATPLAGRIRVHLDDTYRDVQLDDAGRFSIGPVVPGEFRFEVVPDDDTLAGTDLPIRALRAKETLDLGDVFVTAKGR